MYLTLILVLVFNLAASRFVRFQFCRRNCPSIHALRCPVTGCADVKMLNVSNVFKKNVSIKLLRAVFCTFHNLLEDM
jgi:hypothetical protein